PLRHFDALGRRASGRWLGMDRTRRPSHVADGGTHEASADRDARGTPDGADFCGAGRCVGPRGRLARGLAWWLAWGLLLVGRGLRARPRGWRARDRPSLGCPGVHL